MTTSSTVSNLLSKRMSDIKEPTALPNGPYLFTVGEHKTVEPEDTSKTPYIEFELNIQAPGPGNDSDLTDVDFPRVFRWKGYVSDAALYRIRDFCAALGIDESYSLEEAVPMTPGRSGMVELKQVPSRQQGSNRMYNEVVAFASA